ncbi:membrane-associated protein, putative [Bodo saltans]|uniref:Membrane-associated protein, putative n=1 Tax=Bodo saltans TaxID=75058 RepID=A0A0S4JK77_BODSA|nr:membrane-associated protein, putative [Bodo saltans]|eukprot:CUG91883.1 membrane-associated protein, putative [Bodo saltans]
MEVTRKQPAPFGSSKLVVVALVFIIQLLSFRTQSTNAAFTDLSCSVTVISGSSTADTYRYSNCNQASSTITVSSAAAVTFVSSTFMGIYHPNAMSGYSLIIQSTTITCGTGVNLIRFAGAVLSSTISISSSTTLTASSWAAAFDFQGGSGGGNAISALGMTILSSTLKPSMNLFSINGDITSSTISISGTGITTGYYGFAITGAATALTVLMSQLTMSCQYYNFYIQGAVTNSKFYLVTVTASSNIIEIFQGNTGNWSNSQITVEGGSLSASITQTSKAAIRINNLLSSCTILVTGATLIGDYGITLGAISGTTSISIIGSTISAAASKSGYALQIGYGTDYTKSGSVYISSSSLIGDSAAMYFGNTWTSMTVSVTSSTLVGATIAILMSGYMGGITFTAANSRISTTTTTTGQAIQTPAITTASTFSFSSTTFIANKLMWASQVITTPSVTFTFSSSTISMNSAFLQVSTTTVKNLQIVLSSSTVTIPSGTLFVGSSVNGVVLSNCGITITSCTVSAGTIFNPGAYSTTGTGIAIVITGTTGSRSSLTLSSGVFYDSSTSACTFTSLSLTMGNTAVTTNTGVLGGSSSGYLRLSSPSISFASTVSLTNYAVVFYGAITSGTMFFGQGTLSGSTSGGYHSFNGYVTSTTVTFSAITVTGPAGLSTWNGGCSSCTILISNVAATITGTSTASLIGFFSATYTGMQLTITSSSLSYTVSTASAFVSPIFTSSATLSGSTLRVVGNTISSTTSATAHTVAFLYSSGTTTISSSSVITLAKTTVSVAVSTVTPIYLAQATVTGSSISLLCHSFTSITVPMVRLNVFTASTLAVQSVAIWSSQVAGLAAITIAGSSSATATIAFADSFMHAPVVVSAASTSSVSLIKADCSWASYSYALNPASFVSGLQSAVTSQLSCSSLVYTSGTCWTEDTLSRTSSSSSSQSEEQTQSETYSFQQSLSKSHSPATPSSSKESTETDSQSPDQSRSLSRSFPTPSQTQEQSRTSTFTDEITQSFSSSASRSGSWERSKSQSPTGEHASATLSTISRSPSPRTQSLSKTTSKSFSPVVPNRVGALVSFPSNSGVSIGSSYYAESGVQVLLLTAAGGFQDGVAVAATLELFPRLLDNRNVSWTGYMRSPQVTPTSLSLTTAVGSSSRISLSSPGTCTTSFLPCTAAVAITPVLSSASTVGQFNVQVGYQSGAYEVPAVSDIGFDTDRRPVSFGVLNTTQQAMVVPSSSGTMFMAAGLPPDTRHLVLQLFDMFGNIAAFAGPQDALSVITTFFASGNQTPAIQQSNAPVTTSDTYDILNPLGTAPVWFTDAGSGNLTVSLASGLPVSGGSQSTSLTINVSSTKCSVLLSGAIVSATPDQLTTTVTYGYPVTADSDDQLLCAWGTSPMTSTDIGVNIPANVAFASAPLRVSACSVSCNSLITANAAVSKSYLCRSVLQQGSCELLLSTAALAQVATPSPTMTAESSPSPNVVALFNTFTNSAPVMACSVITFLSLSNAQSPTLSVGAMNATNIAISTTTQLTAQLMSTGDVLTVGQVVVSPWMNGTTSSGWEVCAVNLSFANGTQVFDLPINARSVTVTISSIAFSGKLRSGSSFSVTQGNFIGGASWAYTLRDTACLGNTTALRTVVLTTPSSSIQTFVNATGTLQTTTYVRYAIASSSGSTALFLSDLTSSDAIAATASSSGSTALFLSDLTSSDAIAATTSTNRTITFDIRSATLLARTDVTPVDTSVLVFRTDGYYDSGSFRRVALATPTITSMDGCPTTYYPSTAECPLNGTVALNISGSGFNSTLYPNFIVGWQFPSLVQPIFCQQLTIISDVLARCTLYPGAGLYGVARVFTSTSDPTNPTVVSTSNATMSFTLFGSLDCPVGAANGLQCSGHGTCDFTSGLCTCYQTASLGFWTSKDCSSCTQRYNNSVNCQALCPTNADGLICSGVGYCNQGQCWCGSSWSTSTCVLCPGQESQCSGHGTCDQSTGTCTCTLNDYQGYFNGSACDTCFNGFSGSSCTLACPQDPSGNICSNNGACYNGVCFCISTFCGVRCELDKATQDCLGCSNPSLYGPTCSSVCPGSSIPAAPCNGHGICDAGQQGTGACKCSKGYGSADCSVICPLTSTGVECSGNGYCSLSSGLCQCDRFYATPSCSVQCPVSGGVACSGHGACNEGSAGNGQCVCAVGYGGPACNITCLGDVPCNGHGICLTTGMCLCYTDSTNGFWGGSACTDCTNGYAGKLCNARCPQNASGTPCSGHGVCGADLTCTCYNSAGLGFWSGVACDDCSPGYFGSSCLNECPAGACSPCGGNGVCSQGVTGSGTCACIANSAFGQWGGSDCLSCAAGFYGTSCLSVCPMLNGVTCPNGACDGGPLGTGVCNCKLGFTRDPNGHCLLCSPGYYSTLCLACPSTSNGTCSGRGVCDDGIAGSGKCRCFGTSGGVACASNCPTAADGTLCGNGGTCSATVGTCVCSGNFTLDNAGLCNNCISGKYGTACNLFCQPCGYGTCNRNTGACDCTTGVTTSEQRALIATCAMRLRPVKCRARPSAGRCAVAEVLATTAAARTATPNPQSTAIGIVCGYACELRDDSCILSSCPTGYYGLLCNQQCPGANISNPATLNATTCGGAGLCDGNGLCHCNAGYYGTECESHCPAAVISGSARVCSARGSCRDGVCGCLAGYFGAACEVECPGGAATPCNARGVCSNATCTCYYGAVGTACETLCPGGLASPCSYHGTCQSTGACLCYSDAKNGYFRGLQCDECAEFYTGPTCTIQCLPSRGVIVGTSCACFSGFARADCSALCTPSALGVVCGGHGTCVEQETCRCDINYYGPRCGTYCTYDLCRSNLGLYRPQCNITTGACECRSSSIGQWAGALCDTCSTTTWGDECNFPCSCNNHGVCARTSGLCSCFGDPNNGFWSGTACGECRTGYFGVTCQSINVAITPASTPSSVARANVATPVNSWMLFDAESLLTLKGSTASTTVDVLGSTLSGSIDTLRTLTSPLGTVHALLLNSTHLLIVLIGGGKMVVLRNRTSLLSLPNLPLPQQRSMEELHALVNCPHWRWKNGCASKPHVTSVLAQPSASPATLDGGTSQWKHFYLFACVCDCERDATVRIVLELWCRGLRRV